ncbi:MAG: hypothetical protein M3083_09045 [Actinomycetota bacterium]|nr:hypothetical protein [Actinomycetota bacterium]
MKMRSATRLRLVVVAAVGVAIASLVGCSVDSAVASSTVRSQRKRSGGSTWSAPVSTSNLSATVATAAAGGSIYWGAYAAGSQYGFYDGPWDMRSAGTFESHAGKGMSLLEWGQDWYECSTTCGLRPFRADLMSAARSRGYIPVLSWGSYAEKAGVNQRAYSLKAILSGEYDRFIRKWALGAKNWGHPFLLRFDWEMNTHSVPYSQASNGNQPGQFTAMWRHVHDIFEQVGATNATWVWCPNVEYPGSLPLTTLYPGDGYVDWTCLDGYNWGTNPNRPGSTWQSFTTVFGTSYDQVSQLAPTKPMLIGETAASEYGGSKAAWISDALGPNLLTRFPAVKGLVWFNKDADNMDWIIETSASARAAFASAIAAPVFAGSRFAGLATGKVLPLGGP